MIRDSSGFVLRYSFKLDIREYGRTPPSPPPFSFSSSSRFPLGFYFCGAFCIFGVFRFCLGGLGDLVVLCAAVRCRNYTLYLYMYLYMLFFFS